MGYPFIFPCTTCNTLHTRTLPNLKSAVQALESGRKLAFCSKKCRQDWHKLNRRQSTCTNCLNSFYQIQSTQKFCSKGCYSSYMKENPHAYELDKKAQQMRDRSKTTKEVQTSKMLLTKLERGKIVDWHNSTWKQFWRRCNYLTRVKRRELLPNWDGYDYIDGEYIRPYLQLPHSHANYPTLDHVIARSVFFKEGKTPEEACKESNLKWTKRSNNSRKYNK